MSSISSSESLYIPPELLSHIFSFCPSSSLAVVTRANLACLELASPFLYRSVRLEGAQAIQKFFGIPEDDLKDAVEPDMPLWKRLDLLGVSLTEESQSKEEGSSSPSFLPLLSLSLSL